MSTWKEAYIVAVRETEKFLIPEKVGRAPIAVRNLYMFTARSVSALGGAYKIANDRIDGKTPEESIEQTRRHFGNY